jgi:hypothetical protein
MKTLRSELDALAWVLRVMALAAVAGAVYQELQLPPEERTWHGRLLGFLPYDLRPPTPAKLLRAWWDPDSSRVIVDMPFGVGWTVNVAALAQRAGIGQDGETAEV